MLLTPMAPTTPKKRQRGRNVVLTSFTRREGSFIVVLHIASANATSVKSGSQSARLGPRYEGMAACPLDLHEHHAAARSRDEHHQLQGCARDGDPTFALFCASFEGETQNGGVLHC